MYGMFVADNGCMHYADYIVDGLKTIETRNKNMLMPLFGHRVAVIRTRKGKKPVVIGYTRIHCVGFYSAKEFNKFYERHLVQPGSKYAPQNGRGKWFYFLSGSERCEPYLLPENTIRHGRSWCEF